jgi:hypothetical protein
MKSEATMPIIFDCACGAEIEALDGQVGRKLRCPACRSELTVPRRSVKWKPEPVPDLGIAIPDVTALSERPRRSRAGIRRAIVRNAAVGLLIWTGSLFLAVLVWGLVFAPARQAGPPAVIDPGGAVELPGGYVEAVDPFEQDRLRAIERARREEAEELARQGAVEAQNARP